MVNYEKKHLFIMSAIGLLILMPLFLLTGPFIFQGILFDDPSVWLIQTPTQSYWLYAISIFLLALSLFLSYFYTKFSIFITILGIILAGVFFTMGTFTFKSLSTEEITWGEPLAFKTHVYSWEDVKEVILVSPPNKEEKHTMVFYFKDGNEVTFIRNIAFQTEFSNFNTARRQYNFPFTASE
ncbi:hypothetical protein [Sutcliffiella halmapala]|uniref:hypothetical protein n=1 Tax=Sutcliffiella halmapala TaxID=79882 RepID=UPI0009956481|nr:hypothetical protein [Sutcliffiella halmapala]